MDLEGGIQDHAELNGVKPGINDSRKCPNGSATSATNEASRFETVNIDNQKCSTAKVVNSASAEDSRVIVAESCLKSPPEMSCLPPVKVSHGSDTSKTGTVVMVKTGSIDEEKVGPGWTRRNFSSGCNPKRPIWVSPDRQIAFDSRIAALQFEKLRQSHSDEFKAWHAYRKMKKQRRERTRVRNASQYDDGTRSGIMKGDVFQASQNHVGTAIEGRRFLIILIH